MSLWERFWVREQPDRPPHAPTADPENTHYHLQTPRHRKFQQLHCAARETEAQGRDGTT